MTTDNLQTDTTSKRARKRGCNSLHCGPHRRTAVYRLYDRNQRLLYVGIAHDTKKRWREHARDKHWWNQVHWYTAVWHTSRLGAAIEEYCSFRYENPIYNKNREYDHRLGWEPGDAPGHHQPRPWRLGLLTSAMTLPDGGISWNDAAPHYAAVRCRDTSSTGAPRIWFPQIPELGYWNCNTAESGSKADVYRSAASVLTKRYGLEPGSFTLSLHDADKCSAPTLERWTDPAEEEAAAIEPLPDRPWWKKVDALWRTPGPALFVMEWWGNATIGMFAATTLNVYVALSHHYSPGGVMLMGMAGGLFVRAANKLMNWWDRRTSR